MTDAHPHLGRRVEGMAASTCSAHKPVLFPASLLNKRRYLRKIDPISYVDPTTAAHPRPGRRVDGVAAPAFLLSVALPCQHERDQVCGGGVGVG